ncbi:MAG: glutamyl-tRNA reductase [Thermodesulfobacteriota bacterium]
MQKKENIQTDDPIGAPFRPDILLIGLNHRTAPVELRECIAFSESDTETGLEELLKEPNIQEVILFSTCNRVEVLLVANDEEKAVWHVKKFISGSKAIPVSEFENSLYIYRGDRAIQHIFRVASSLDSMIVGEPQILGQIRAAYRIATAKKATGVILNRLLHRAFFVAKRVRTETGIGDHAVSISYAAVELGRKIFDTLNDRKVLLIGAGEMAELAVDHLIRNRVGGIFVANRTFERGVELAQRFGGKPLRFEEIEASLHEVDIIISSTGSPDFVIRKDQIKKVIRTRKNRPLFFIDIAVPRNIDPEINRLPNSYVYDIDDLKEIIDENINDRKIEAARGERIVDESVIFFRKWFETLDVVPTVVMLRSRFESIIRSEAAKTLQSLGYHFGNDNQAIDRMTNAMVNKILHEPTLFLKGLSGFEAKSRSLDMIRKLFKLDE